MSIAERLHRTAKASFWRTIAPELHIDNRPASARLDLAPQLDAEVARMRSDGRASLERVVPVALCSRLADAVRRLHDARIPTPFLYVFDEAWEVAAELAGAFEALVGGEPWILPDVWAWFVPRDARARGWAPHRGVDYDVRDARGTPTLVNAWIALSDVTADAACMHVVPLPVDPHYPHSLDRIDVPEALGVPLPVPAGSLLAWNGNVLHWGGRMAESAHGPRISMSFTVRRDSEPGAMRPGEAPAFDARVDLVADMLVTYDSSARVAPDWLEWARLSRGMRKARAGYRS
ncbi:MAG TPA: phytanoyl-CoA dioxygenase family protein [Polyangiaceae bacterium]|nr:phytanoyl-CoA dioxygenase family protein [Polyangiaceae bacterium]